MRHSCSMPGVRGRQGASSANHTPSDGVVAGGEWFYVPQVLAPRAQSHRRAEAIDKLRPRPRPANWTRTPGPKFAIALFERRTVGILDVLY